MFGDVDGAFVGKFEHKLRNARQPVVESTNMTRTRAGLLCRVPPPETPGSTGTWASAAGHLARTGGANGTGPRRAGFAAFAGSVCGALHS